MTTEQLRYFITVAESGSFSETAAQLNISQSSVTKQLQSLERELGVILFDRSHRSVCLSDAGKKLAPALRDILIRQEAVLQDAKGYSLRQQNMVRIAALPFIGQYHLADVLKQFESQTPEAQLIIHEVEEPALLEALEKNTCDLALTRQELLPADTYETSHLISDRLVLIVGKNHPLSQFHEVEVHQLQHETFMLMEMHTVIYKLSMQLFEKHGITPHILQNSRIESIIGNVEAGRCCGLLMETALNIFQSNNINKIMLRPSVTSHIVIAKSRAAKQAPHAKKLFDFMAQFDYDV